jgi:hypothetical protein
VTGTYRLACWLLASLSSYPVRAQQDALSLCQLKCNQPPFKLQTPGKTIYVYCNYSHYIIVGSTVVKETVWFAHDGGLEPSLSKLLLFDFHLHRNVKLNMPDMYVLYKLSEQVCTLTCMSIHICCCIYMSQHGMY